MTEVHKHISVFESFFEKFREYINNKKDCDKQCIQTLSDNPIANSYIITECKYKLKTPFLNFLKEFSISDEEKCSILFTLIMQNNFRSHICGEEIYRKHCGENNHNFVKTFMIKSSNIEDWANKIVEKSKIDLSQPYEKIIIQKPYKILNTPKQPAIPNPQPNPQTNAVIENRRRIRDQRREMRKRAQELAKAQQSQRQVYVPPPRNSGHPISGGMRISNITQKKHPYNNTQQVGPGRVRSMKELLSIFK